MSLSGGPIKPLNREALRHKSANSYRTAQSLKVIALQNPYIFNFSQERRNIGVGSYSFAIASSHRYLKTNGVVGCIALAIYCRDTKVGALAHIVTGTCGMEELLAEKIKPLIKGNDLEIRIISPHAGKDFRQYVADAVKKVFGRDADVGEKDNDCTTYSVELDTLTGSITIEKTEDVWVRQFVHTES